jgi:hypothetical protein
MSHRSIRFRLTIWYSTALASGLILFALATWLSMRQLLLRDVRQVLTHQVESSRAYVETELREPDVRLGEELSEFSVAFPAGAYLRISDDRKAVVFESNRAFPWPSESSRIQWKGRPYLVLLSQGNVNGKPWSFEVSASLSETESSSADFDSASDPGGFGRW